MTDNSPLPLNVENVIYLVRGHKVMLDEELARLYDVETRILTRAVRRNGGRFQPDFMFQLSDKEVSNLRSQIGISSSSYGGRRYRPLVFHRTGHCNAIHRFTKQERRTGKHRNHARLRKTSRIHFVKSGDRS